MLAGHLRHRVDAVVEFLESRRVQFQPVLVTPQRQCRLLELDQRALEELRRLAQCRIEAGQFRQFGAGMLQHRQAGRVTLLQRR